MGLLPTARYWSEQTGTWRGDRQRLSQVRRLSWSVLFTRSSARHEHEEAGISDWDEFTSQLLDALRRFVQGDAEPYKSLWSHADDVTIFGGWGTYE